MTAPRTRIVQVRNDFLSLSSKNAAALHAHGDVLLAFSNLRTRRRGSQNWCGEQRLLRMMISFFQSFGRASMLVEGKDPHAWQTPCSVKAPAGWVTVPSRYWPVFRTSPSPRNIITPFRAEESGRRSFRSRALKCLQMVGLYVKVRDRYPHECPVQRHERGFPRAWPHRQAFCCR